MSLRSRITGSSDQTEADQATVDETGADDGTTVRPTFTPAPDRTADQSVPLRTAPADDVAAQTPTLVQPDGPVEGVGPADAVGPGEGAGDYDAGDYDAGYGAADRVDGVAPAEPVASYTAVDSDTSATTSPAAAAGAGQAPVTGKHAAQPAADYDLDQPLFSDNTELRSRWPQVQAEFVDDPQLAVAGAADLVNTASQALVDALRQRQQEMRAQWDRSGDSATDVNDSDRITAGGADTEQLRLLMRRYRELFDQLCQPI